jgi:hypothetical protein
MSKRFMTRTTCDYCDFPEKFNLTTKTFLTRERSREPEGTRWHEERTALSGLPKKRIRCQKGS